MPYEQHHCKLDKTNKLPCVSLPVLSLHKVSVDFTQRYRAQPVAVHDGRTASESLGLFLNSVFCQVVPSWCL